jgi:site-specific DNA-methyltransferase (adenine-specific)
MLWLSKCYQLLREGAPVGLFTDWRQLPIISDALQCAGFVWRGIAVWDKGNSRPVKGRYRSQCEYLVWGSRGAMASEGECLPGCWQVPIVGAKKQHIAAKPVLLMGHINKIVPPGGVIFDPFMGSGSTGVAAVQDKRRFVGVELLDVHFETACRRLEEAQAQQDLFTGPPVKEASR